MGLPTPRAITWALCLVTLLTVAGGCESMPGTRWFDSLKGPGFSGWEEAQGAGFRPKSADTKPSGKFFDRRSEQIESNLGINQ